MAFALSSPAFKKEIYGVKRADAEPSARRGGSIFSGAHAVVSEVGTGTRDGPHEDTGWDSRAPEHELPAGRGRRPRRSLVRWQCCRNMAVVTFYGLEICTTQNQAF